MATMHGSAQQLQDNINLIEDLLQKNGPDYADRALYEQMLQEQYEDLETVQRSLAATSAQMSDHPVSLELPYLARPVSPASSSGASRKRSIGHSAAYPDSKRPSMNPSPLTPNTPNSAYSEPTDYRQVYASSSRQQALPLAPEPNFAQGYQDYNRHQMMPSASSRPIQSDIIDLTESNPPTPDPFPELHSAFQSGAPQPVDAFGQDFMSEEDLAQFLLAPTPACTSYAFQQSLPIHQQPLPFQYHIADTPPAAYEAPEVPLFVGNAGAPWAPSDNEDEYGAPLTLNEAQAVENLLGNVSAHDAEDSPERREQTPSIMCSQLKEYQKIGLTWLMKVLSVSG